jgi:hypothetical protein
MEDETASVDEDGKLLFSIEKGIDLLKDAGAMCEGGISCCNKELVEYGNEYCTLSIHNIQLN